MIYNFRCDQAVGAKTIERIKTEHRISQGWGGGHTDLDVRREGFVQSCFNAYQPAMRSTRVPTNLTRMRKFKDGDLLVTPHLPQYGKAIVTVVDGDFPDCYDYVANDDDHQNHRIRVREWYGLEGNIDIHAGDLSAWFAKLQSLQLPVLPIPEFEEAFGSLVRELEREPQKVFQASPLKLRFEKVVAGVIETMKADLRTQFSNAGAEFSFEAWCERLLTDNGYSIVRRNRHKDGGDVDLECERQRVDLSPFEAGRVNLFVQVKKYDGTADDLAVRPLLKMMENDQTADGCVMSLGNDFTPEAVKLAAENVILLMNGATICRLLLKQWCGTEPIE